MPPKRANPIKAAAAARRREEPAAEDKGLPDNVRLVCQRAWLEDEAVRQLVWTATNLEGVVHAVGMPDLHPGRTYPVGAAIAARGRIYPHLVGSDIGCGMALFRTTLRASKIKAERWAARLVGLEGPWGEPAERAAFLRDEAGLGDDAYHPDLVQYGESLGTIGAGNHFAELVHTHEIVDDGCGFDPDAIYLLVHSGSRGLGSAVLRGHEDQFGAAGLDADSDAARDYLAAHNRAEKWARANRLLIARRFVEALGTSIEELVLDITHNSVTPTDFSGETLYLHRKGAAPTDRGLVAIPGSRGDLSFVVRPSGDNGATAIAGHSLAHGAGRKWARGKAREAVRQKYGKDRRSLLKTRFDSIVICEAPDLVLEEAPECYKAISDVIADLEDHGLAQVAAVFEPCITYKVRA